MASVPPGRAGRGAPGSTSGSPLTPTGKAHSGDRRRPTPHTEQRRHQSLERLPSAQIADAQRVHVEAPLVTVSRERMSRWALPGWGWGRGRGGLGRALGAYTEGPPTGAKCLPGAESAAISIPEG